MSKKIPTPTKIKLNDQEVERLLEALDENKRKTLSLQEASDWLNVSLEFLIKLLDNNEIDFVETCGEQKVEVIEAIRYKLQNNRERSKTLDELTKISEEMGLYRRLEGEGD